MRRQELERHLSERGCEIIREGAKHTIWCNPARDLRACAGLSPEAERAVSGDNEGVTKAIALAALGGIIVVSVGSGRGAPANPCPLSLKFGTRSVQPSGQIQLDLVFMNTPYEAPCRVAGVPGVELIGPVNPRFGSIYQLPDQVGRSERIVLRSGQSAHAVLTWLPPSVGSDRWVPGYIRVVVPTTRGPSFAMALPWRFGPVLRQDGATHPGTYIGPLRPGSR